MPVSNFLIAPHIEKTARKNKSRRYASRENCPATCFEPYKVLNTWFKLPSAKEIYVSYFCLNDTSKVRLTLCVSSPLLESQIFKAWSSNTAPPLFYSPLPNLVCWSQITAENSQFPGSSGRLRSYDLRMLSTVSLVINLSLMYALSCPNVKADYYRSIRTGALQVNHSKLIQAQLQQDKIDLRTILYSVVPENTVYNM